MKILAILPLFLVAFLAQAQKGTRAYSLSYGNGNGKIRPILVLAKLSGSYTNGSINTLGLDYNFGIKKHMTFETGLHALRHNYTYTDYSIPMEKKVTTKTMNAAIIPFKLRFNIWKYFFISGGLSLNLDASNGINSTFGLGIGGGIQYYHKNKYGVFIYPQANVHTIGIGLAESHIAFGLSYRINKP